MTVYLVTYDLKKPGQDYTHVHEAIKNCGAWWHYLESTWLVDTYLTAQQVADRVKLPMDNNDNLLVIEVLNNKAGWLPAKAWDWINERRLRAA